MDALPKIAIVLPVHNEATNVAPMAAKLGGLLQPSARWQIVFVDDGSSDNSLAAIKRLAATDRRIRYVALARNFGHQMALRAGLHYAEGDAVIVMDCDFEHPPELVPQLIEEWRRGAKIVLTRRLSGRAHASVFKRWSSRLFYSLFDAISDVRVEPGSPDFMLLDRAAVDAIGKFENQDVFLRGLVRWLGFPTVRVSFTPGVRHAGKTKYSLRRMVDFAMMGIVAHSIKPLRMAIYLSFVFALLGVLLVVYSLFSLLFVDRTVAGWTSLMSAMAILGAGQFLVLGIIGEYIGRVLREVRRWPLYLVAETDASLCERSTDTPIGADTPPPGSDKVAVLRTVGEA
jgi:polyisoprenyl-phosphate glycosyltransferase